MSELMDKMLAGKRKTREALAALPFEEKLVLIEKMRDRSLLLAANPLRRPTEDRVREEENLIKKPSGDGLLQGKPKQDVNS